MDACFQQMVQKSENELMSNSGLSSALLYLAHSELV